MTPTFICHKAVSYTHLDVYKRQERIHRHAINDKEVKEQVEAYLPGLEESEKYKDKFPNEVYVQLYQNNFLEGKPITSIEEDIAYSREILSELTAKDFHDWIASWNSNYKNWVFILSLIHI